MITSLKTHENNSLDNYRRIFKNYKIKLGILCNLEEGMKLGKTYNEMNEVKEEVKEVKEEEIKIENNIEYKKLIINGEYNIFKNHTMQKLSRWWYSEDREKTFKYLDEDFTKVMKFLDKIKENTTYFNIKKFDSLLEDINLFINKIIPGLYNLKKTYIEEKKMKAKIDSIILVFIDFKREIKTKINGKNKKNKEIFRKILSKAYEV